ncbi:MAG: hypothetical protein EON52_27430 [Actinomycetales bacterium]|nr:MAG: hypothetical protein EON52_27430 [Actinomycetales bacterium]
MILLRAVLLAVLVALVVPFSPAAAQKVTIKDSGGAGDVWDQVWSYESEEPTHTEAGSVPNADVVRTTVTYTADLVRVKLTYVDLQEPATWFPMQVSSWLRLAGGGGALFWASVEEGKQYYGFFTDETAKPGGKIRQKRCAGMKADFDTRRDVATVTVPASCLPGDPAWVKYHGLTSSTEIDPENPEGLRLHSWIDNVTDDSYEVDTNKRDCFWTCSGWTKVRRG